MFALTAFHDMAAEALLPAAAAEHAPYLGFKAGDVINDHDLALGYVLDHADVLPSFAGLTAGQALDPLHAEQDAVQPRLARPGRGAARAALCQVQGDARGRPAGVSPSTLCLATDLAGAEPSPLGGEKFVLSSRTRCSTRSSAPRGAQRPRRQDGDRGDGGVPRPHVGRCKGCSTSRTTASRGCACCCRRRRPRSSRR